MRTGQRLIVVAFLAPLAIIIMFFTLSKRQGPTSLPTPISIKNKQIANLENSLKISGVSVSPERNKALVSGVYPLQGKPFFTIIDLRTGRSISQSPLPPKASSPRWANGDRIWYIDWGSGKVIVLNLQGRKEFSIPLPPRSEPGVRFSLDLKEGMALARMAKGIPPAEGLSLLYWRKGWKQWKKAWEIPEGVTPIDLEAVSSTTGKTSFILYSDWYEKIKKSLPPNLTPEQEALLRAFNPALNIRRVDEFSEGRHQRTSTIPFEQILPPSTQGSKRIEIFDMGKGFPSHISPTRGEICFLVKEENKLTTLYYLLIVNLFSKDKTKVFTLSPLPRHFLKRDWPPTFLWAPDGKKILVWSASSVDNHPTFIWLLNLEGEHLFFTQHKVKLRRLEWFSEEKVIGWSEEKLYYLDLRTPKNDSLVQVFPLALRKEEQ